MYRKIRIKPKLNLQIYIFGKYICPIHTHDTNFCIGEKYVILPF